MVRQFAATALGELGSARAVESLAKALYDDDIDVQEKAARALGKIADPESVRILKSIQDSFQQQDSFYA
jgi:HEAT repeat protein